MAETSGTDEPMERREKAYLFGVGAWGGFVVAFVIGLVILVAGFGGSNAPEPAELSLDDGARIFQQNCAACHGAGGEGLIGPQLAGRVETVYPDIADQIAVITAGRNNMPSFASQLSEAEIDAVARYERQGL